MKALESLKEFRAYSRWGIGGLAILLVIAGVAFLGTSRNRNSVEAHGALLGNSTGAVIFASPGRVEGASETTQVGAAADGVLKAVYVRGSIRKKRNATG